MPSFFWFVVASLSALGAVGYNISVRVATEHINPFFFTVVMTLFAFTGHILAYLIYKYTRPAETVIEYNATGLSMAAFAGLSIVLIDLAFFYAVMSGGLVLSKLFWVIGGMTLTMIAAVLLFQEPMTMQRVFGIVLGCIALVLIIKG